MTSKEKKSKSNKHKNDRKLTLRSNSASNQAHQGASQPMPPKVKEENKAQSLKKMAVSEKKHKPPTAIGIKPVEVPKLEKGSEQRSIRHINLKVEESERTAKKSSKGRPQLVAQQVSRKQIAPSSKEKSKEHNHSSRNAAKIHARSATKPIHEEQILPSRRKMEVYDADERSQDIQIKRKPDLPNLKREDRMNQSLKQAPNIAKQKNLGLNRSISPKTKKAEQIEQEALAKRLEKFEFSQLKGIRLGAKKELVFQILFEEIHGKGDKEIDFSMNELYLLSKMSNRDLRIHFLKEYILENTPQL